MARCANSEGLAREEEKWASNETLYEAFVDEVEDNDIMIKYQELEEAYNEIRHRYEFDESFKDFISNNY